MGTTIASDSFTTAVTTDLQGAGFEAMTVAVDTDSIKTTDPNADDDDDDDDDEEYPVWIIIVCVVVGVIIICAIVEPSLCARRRKRNQLCPKSMGNMSLLSKLNLNLRRSQYRNKRIPCAPR